MSTPTTPTPKTDAFREQFKHCGSFAEYRREAERFCGELERELSAATAACAAMREALEVVYRSNALNPFSSLAPTTPIECLEVLDKALSNPAGQDILAELRVVRETCDEQSKIIMECANARDEWKAAWTALNDDTGRQLSAQSARIAELEGALRNYAFHDCLSTEQQKVADDALAAKGGETV